MKSFAVITLLVFIETQFIYCSAGPPPPPPLFINAEISGAVHIAPLFLTDTSKITIIAGAAYFPSSSLSYDTKVEGTSVVRTENTQNLNWKIPSATYTLGISFQLSQWFKINTAVNFDSREGFMNFAGSDFGLGIILSPHKEANARLNFGLYQWGVNYNANFQTSSSYQGYPLTDTIHFMNTSKGLRPYISLILNSAMPEWLFNPFLQISYNQQLLFTLADTYSQEVYCKIAYFTFTPGVSYRLSEKFLVLAGSNIVLPYQLQNSSSDLIASGFAQVNFRIN